MALFQLTMQIHFAIFVAQRALALAIAGINCSVAYQLANSLPPFCGIPGGPTLLRCISLELTPDGIVFDVVPPSSHGQCIDGAYPVQHALELKVRCSSTTV